MNGRQNMLLWIALAVAMVFGAAIEWGKTVDASQRLEALPLDGSMFSSSPMPISPQEIAFYDKARIVKRVYQCKKGSFILIAVDGSANRHAVHDPLYCLKGAGWEITNRQTITIDGGVADLLHLSRNGQDREALFWFSDGSSRHASVLRYWLQTSLRRLTFGTSGKEPVMIILQSIGHDRPDWLSLLNRCIFLYEI
jgi:hypothetical protein